MKLNKLIANAFQLHDEKPDKMLNVFQNLIENLDKDKKPNLRLWVLSQIVDQEMQRQEEYENKN